MLSDFPQDITVHPVPMGPGEQPAAWHAAGQWFVNRRENREAQKHEEARWFTPAEKDHVTQICTTVEARRRRLVV